MNKRNDKLKKEYLNDDISFFDLFKEFYDEIILLISIVKKKIKLFLIISVFGSFFAVSYTFIDKPLYNAKLNFLVTPSSGTSSVLSSLSGLAGMFGIGNSVGSSLESALKLVESDNIIINALFNKIKVKNNEVFLINYFIDIENLREKWKKNKDTISYKVNFDSNYKNFNDFNYSQRKVLKQIKNMIYQDNGEGIISKSFDMKSGIIQIEALHEDELFAIELTNAVYNELFNFYTTKSLYASKNNVEILMRKVDSIKLELNKTQNLLAKASDKRLGPSRFTLEENKVELRNLMVQEQMLIVMYGEAQKNLETFRVMSDNESLPLTLMDYPFSPITPIQKNKLFYLILGFIIPSIIYLIYCRIKLLFDK